MRPGTAVHSNPFTGHSEESRDGSRGSGGKDKIQLFSCQLSDGEMAEKTSSVLHNPVDGQFH